VLRGFSRADENDRDLVVVAHAKFGVFVYVDFSQARAEFLQHRSDLGFGFLAKMASGAGVDCYVTASRKLQAAIFGARVSAWCFSLAQPASFHES
jgi:hypothetical protein